MPGVEAAVETVRDQGRAVRDNVAILGKALTIVGPGEARNLVTHPLPHWVERMTVSYVQAHGGAAERNDLGWNLTWPDGKREGAVVFSVADAERLPSRTTSHAAGAAPPRAGDADPAVHSWATDSACLALKELPSEVRGFWSLWRIALHAPEGSRHRVMPLFRHEDGRVLAPTARFVWDRMLADRPSVREHVEGEGAAEAFDRVQESAHEHGRPIYEELVQAYRRPARRRTREGRLRVRG